MSLPTVEAARVDALPVFSDARGALTVVEFSRSVPFPVVRLFYISGVPTGTSRGGHGHYRCNQYVICQSGRLQVLLADGVHERSFELSAGQAILIESGIFATQTYLDADSAALVLCDRPFEADDYIDDMDTLLKYRAEKA